MRFHDWINNIRWKYFTNNKAGLIFKELTKEFRIVYKMTENKRFELTINERGQADIIDKVESKEKNAICIYNDLGVLPYSSAKAVCDLLNEQEERIKELEEENETLKDAIDGLADSLAHTIDISLCGDME